MKCGFWFFLQILSETFFMIRRNERDIVEKIYSSSCNVPVINETWIFSIITKKFHTSNFTEIRAVGAELFHVDGQTERERDMISFLKPNDIYIYIVPQR